ncbi:MAG TPA: signal peptidase I [Patescibacteria group bacterium]|nr:signal peptidase I [Patescibacteria group bacterium]
MTNRRTLGCLLEVVQTLVLTVVLFWVVQSFVAQPFQVRQLSMEPTIENNEYVLIDKLTPRFDSYHRGDVVVFAPPRQAATQLGEPFIKRIIGVAGDRIELRDGGVIVNGTVLDEPYLFGVEGVPEPTEPESDETSWTIANGDLFVMGDHRRRSSDSRSFGPIKVDSVVGRAWLRYWPLAGFGILPSAGHPELFDPSPPPSMPGTTSTARPTIGPTPSPAS